jgi:nucleoside-diphosphate-sugar epimerase
MARLLRLIRFGVPLPLGGIRNRRSFVFVGNLVDALIRCLDHPGAEGEILAINDGMAVSTPELVRVIGRVSGQKVRIFPFPMALLRLLARLGDLPKAIFGRSVGLDTYSLDRLTGSHAVDARKTFEKLQWQPPHTMEEGLALTLSAELNHGKDLS